MLVSYFLGDPYHRASIVTSSIREQLSEVVMICRLKLILYDYKTIVHRVREHLDEQGIPRDEQSELVNKIINTLIPSGTMLELIGSVKLPRH